MQIKLHVYVPGTAGTSACLCAWNSNYRALTLKWMGIEK